MIDGMEVNSPANLDGSFDFANLLGLDVERIEVLRGPQSALYGSDAVGGVVNIITRRGEGPAKVSGFVEGGTRGTAAAGASVGGATDRVDYFVSANGIRTDGFSSAAEWRENSEKDGYENATVFSKFGVQASDNLRWDFVGRAAKYWSESDDFGSPPSNPLGDPIAIDGTNDPETKGRQFLGRAKATLDLFDGRWRQIFAAGRNHDEYKYYYAGAVDGSYDGDKTKFEYQSNFDLTSDARPEISQGVTVAVDHEINEARVKSAFIDLDRSRDQTGLVGQYNVGFWDQLFLTGSVRQDFNEGFDDETTYRVTGAYLIRQTGTKLRASWGAGIKDPSLYELYGSPGVFPVLPNPDLLPERSRGWDAGIDQSLLDDRLIVETTYFDQRIEDFITTANPPPTFDTRYVNGEGEALIHGLEVGLTVRPIEPLSVRAAYTWLDGEEPDGDPLVRRPERSASLDVNYTFLEQRANVNLGAAYAGRREDDAFRANFSAFRARLDSYVLVNLRGSYQINENTQVYARMENLLDEEYEETFTYGAPGRTAIVGVRASF